MRWAWHAMLLIRIVTAIVVTIATLKIWHTFLIQAFEFTTAAQLFPQWTREIVHWHT